MKDVLHRTSHNSVELDVKRSGALHSTFSTLNSISWSSQSETPEVEIEMAVSKPERELTHVSHCSLQTIDIGTMQRNTKC
jgi:hypothetical protein